MGYTSSANLKGINWGEIVEQPKQVTQNVTPPQQVVVLSTPGSQPPTTSLEITPTTGIPVAPKATITPPPPLFSRLASTLHIYLVKIETIFQRWLVQIDFFLTKHVPAITGKVKDITIGVYQQITFFVKTYPIISAIALTISFTVSITWAIRQQRKTTKPKDQKQENANTATILDLQQQLNNAKTSLEGVKASCEDNVSRAEEIRNRAVTLLLEQKTRQIKTYFDSVNQLDINEAHYEEIYYHAHLLATVDSILKQIYPNYAHWEQEAKRQYDIASAEYFGDLFTQLSLHKIKTAKQVNPYSEDQAALKQKLILQYKEVQPSTEIVKAAYIWNLLDEVLNSISLVYEGNKTVAKIHEEKGSKEDYHAFLFHQLQLRMIEQKPYDKKDSNKSYSKTFGVSGLTPKQLSKGLATLPSNDTTRKELFETPAKQRPDKRPATELPKTQKPQENRRNTQ